MTDGRCFCRWLFFILYRGSYRPFNVFEIRFAARKYGHSRAMLVVATSVIVNLALDLLRIIDLSAIGIQPNEIMPKSVFGKAIAYTV